MTNEQIRKALADKKEVVDGRWEEDYPDEHEWEEDLPFGYAADGVRVRRCNLCDVSLVFDLDSRDSPYIEHVPKVMCGEDEEE